MNRKLAFVAVAAALQAGCATSPPQEEVRMVSKSFAQVNAASQPLLDDLALAERSQGRTAAQARAQLRTDGKPVQGADLKGKDPCPEVMLTGGEKPGIPRIQTGFCVEDSRYYSDLSDPPGTFAFRRALAAVGSYTELLVILAEGRNIPEAKAQLQSIAGDVSGVLSIAGAGAAGAGITAALQALQPLVDLAARDANAAELERLVREQAPKVEAVIAALRKSAPELFRTLTFPAYARFNKEGLASADVAKAEAERIEGYRVAVSNYVVLLEQYQELLGRLVAAYDNRGNVATLAALSQRSAELAARADAWRRSLAELRTGLH